MVALLLAVTGSVLFGLADFAGGLAARGRHTLSAAAISAPTGLTVLLIAWPFTTASWNTGVLTYGALAGLTCTLSAVLLFRSLALGPMNALAPLTALVSALIPALAGLAGGERPGPLALTGLALAPLALTLVNAAPRHTARRPSPTAVLLALGAGGAVAASTLCLHHAPHGSGIAPALVSYTVFTLATSAAALPHAGRPQWHPLRQGLAAASGAADGLGTACLLYAVRQGPLTIMPAIISLSPAATVLLARLFLHEPLPRARLTGLALAAAAITALASG